MTIITDATALILLAKASVLEVFADRNDVVASNIVYKEVVIGKEKGRADGMLVEKLVQEKKIKIKTPNEAEKTRIENLFGLRGGELESTALARKGDVILTDDKKCINTAKVLGIDFITSLDVVISLYKKTVINKQKAIECVEKLETYGWYSKEIIKNYRGELK